MAHQSEHDPSGPPSQPAAPPPSYPGEVMLHLRTDWRPARTERTLDAALWWGQTGERVARRVEAKHESVAAEVAKLSEAVANLGRVAKWIGVLAGSAWIVDTARRVYEWAITLHH